jgi:hypothetical protein
MRQIRERIHRFTCPPECKDDALVVAQVVRRKRAPLNECSVVLPVFASLATSTTYSATAFSCPWKIFIAFVLAKLVMAC